MANGQEVEIEKIWDGYDAKEDKDKVVAWERQRSTNIALATILRPLISETKTNTRFRWLFIGGGIIILSILVPIAVEVLPKLFN